MTTYLTDCLPSCLDSLDYSLTTIHPVSVLFVATHCTSVVDSKIVFSGVSDIGCKKVADLFSSVLTSALHEAKLPKSEIVVPVNHTNIEPAEGDCVICGLLSPSYRSDNISWVFIQF